MARREHQMPNVLRHQAKRPYFYIRYRIRVWRNGQFERKEKQQHLGFCDEITEREAKRRRDEVMREVNRQVLDLPSRISFADFAAIYSERHLPTLTRGAREKYRSLMTKHIVPFFGGTPLGDVNCGMLQDFLNNKRKELSWWTRNDLKGIVSGIYTKAADWGFFTGKNPSAGVALGPKQYKRKKYRLSDRQILMLLNELAEDVQLIVATILSTGLRITELCGCRAGNVATNGLTMTVEEKYYRGEDGDTKTPRSHRVVSLGILAPAYQKRLFNLKPDEYVFTDSNGNPLDDRDLLKRVRPVAKRLGLHHPGFGWRTFRRMNLTCMQEGDEAIHVFDAMAQAGHSRPETTMQYMLLGTGSPQREKKVRELQERWLPNNCAGIVRDNEGLDAA